MSSPKPRSKNIQDRQPHVPPLFEPNIAEAFQALERGDCPPHQQRNALEWLIRLTGFYGVAYQPGDPTATAFAEGKRFIGAQVHKMLIVNPKAFTKEG